MRARVVRDDAPFTLAELDDAAELVGRFVPPTPQFAWPLLADGSAPRCG